MTPPTLHDNYITIDKQTIHYISYKKGKSKTPIVLVHGLAASSRYMIPLAKILANSFDVYAVDLPGFGKSWKPTNALNLPQLSAWLFKIITSLEIHPVVMLGNSFGCQIVVEFAVRYPKTLTHVILVGPTVEKYRRSLIQQAWQGILDVPFEPLPFFLVGMRDSWDVGIKRILQNARYSLSDKIEKKLPKVKVPTLVVRGEKDSLVPAGWASEVVALLPRGELVTVPKVGHVVNFSAPAALATSVKQFCQRHTP